MENNKLLVQADQFAEYAHRSVNQLRKYTDEPYIVHPRNVSTLVAICQFPEKVVAAAVLHDTIEDVEWVTEELITIVFGKEVSALVMEVTDVSKKEDGNREVRKHLDLLHLAQASPEGQSIKLADLIDNTKSIVQYDPGFARKYMKEKRDLLRVLHKGDERLFRIAYLTVLEYFNTYGE